MLQTKGINPVRVCKQHERQYIAQLYASSEKQLREANPGLQRINWRNLYVEGKHYFFQESQEQLKFQRFFAQLINEIFPNSDLVVTSVGFILNPSGCPENQHYHIDVSTSQCGIFIPLVPLSSLNSTQFVNFVPRTLPYELTFFGADDLDFLEREGLDFFEVKQVVCRPYTILRMEAGTIHRGIANRSGYDRPIMWAHAAPGKLDLPQLEFENDDVYHIGEP